MHCPKCKSKSESEIKMVNGERGRMNVGCKVMVGGMRGGGTYYKGSAVDFLTSKMS